MYIIDKTTITNTNTGVSEKFHAGVIIDIICGFNERIQGVDKILTSYAARHTLIGETTIVFDYDDTKETIRHKVSKINGGNYEIINLSGVSDMSYLFYDCNADNLNLSHFNTYKVTNMNSMFESCNINNIQFGEASDNNYGTFNGKLHFFDTRNVSSMDKMFAHSNINGALDLCCFDTSNVVTMCGMFRESKIKDLDISSFSYRRVASTKKMFYCTNIEQNLNMRDAFLDYVKYKEEMFYLFDANTVYISENSSIPISKGIKVIKI